MLAMFRDTVRRGALLLCGAAIGAWGGMGPAAAQSSADPISMCIITKSNTNQVFVLMKEAAQKRADELGIKLISYAGKYSGDVTSQVDAIGNCMSAKVNAILIVPNDTSALVPQVLEARAAGIVVMVIDSPMDPVDAADGTFATDNFQAGVLIGEWAKAYLGDKAADARIAMLDQNTTMVTNDVLRDIGFLTGFGIEVPNKKIWGSETDPRVVGHEITLGTADQAQKAMENMLQRDPTINLVYTTDEDAAAGVAQALRNAGRDDVLLVTVDGTCSGIKMVESGEIAATSMQFWLKMVTDAMDAAHAQITDGTPAPVTPGLDYTDTGTTLLTNRPVDGIASVDSKEAWAMRGNMCEG